MLVRVYKYMFGCKRHVWMIMDGVKTQEISKIDIQFVSLYSTFGTLTHKSMTQIDLTCHCDMSVKS
jgi:hypothetical protein